MCFQYICLGKISKPLLILVILNRYYESNASFQQNIFTNQTHPWEMQESTNSSLGTDIMSLMHQLSEHPC